MCSTKIKAVVCIKSHRIQETEDPKRKTAKGSPKIMAQNNCLSAGLRRTHFWLERDEGSLLDGCLQEKANGTDIVPGAVDQFEKDFAALPDKLMIHTLKFKQMKKGSKY